MPKKGAVQSYRRPSCIQAPLPKGFGLYYDLYPALKPIMHRLHDV